MAPAAQPLTAPKGVARRPTAAVEVRNLLRERIVRGDLLPGDRVSENELAQALALSRTPVREALIKLEEEGLVAIYPQYGSFVAPIRVADIYDGQFVRESLECAAIAKLACGLGPEHASTLQAELALQRRHLLGEPDPFFRADESFHAALLRLAGHASAWAVVDAAKRQHDRVRRLAVRDPLKRRAVFREHCEVVDRLLHHDRPGAVEAMRQHLRGVFASVEAAMTRHPAYFAAPDAAPARPARALKA